MDVKSKKVRKTLRVELPTSNIEVDYIQRPCSVGDQPDCLTEVSQNVFISGYSAACNLEELKRKGITHILNLVSHKFQNKYPEQFEYHSLSLNDTGKNNILLSIEFTLNLILLVQNQAGKILIHCEQGKSRAPTLVAAWLMQTQNMDENDAIVFLQAKRPQVDMNLGFINQLQFLRRPQRTIFGIKQKQITEIGMSEVENQSAIVICDQSKMIFWGSQESKEICMQLLSLLCKFLHRQEMQEIEDFKDLRIELKAF